MAMRSSSSSRCSLALSSCSWKAASMMSEMLTKSTPPRNQSACKWTGHQSWASRQLQHTHTRQLGAELGYKGPHAAHREVAVA